MTPKQIDLVQIRKMASKKEKENWRFRQFLKGSEGLGLLTGAWPRLPSVYGLELIAPPAPTVVANCSRRSARKTLIEWRVASAWIASNSSTHMCKRRRTANQTPGKLAHPVPVFKG